MGLPRSWAKIEFPANHLDDAEIKKQLADYYQYQEIMYQEIMEPDIENGIFILEDGEAVCGEFEELEALLIDKEIPFDRYTAMDWQSPPVLRIYRPAHEILRGVHCIQMDLFIPLNDNDEPVVAVESIRKLLVQDDAAAAIRRYLDDEYTYPPLADWVKEG